MMKINMQFIALALALLFLNVNGASAQDRSYEAYYQDRTCTVGTIG